MVFGRGEKRADIMVEPRPLGIVIDPESAALYDEFAEGRSLDAVYALWKDPEVTNPTIRQRAVTALTAPIGHDLPFPQSDGSVGRLLNITEVVVGKQVSSLRGRLAERPELAEELAAGVIYWWDQIKGRADNKSAQSRAHYQAAIQQLLPLVGEETADRLYARYALNDAEPYWNMDTSSGYKPLINLLYDPQMPRKYKDASVTEWIAIATEEERGDSVPRTEHERASRVMAEFVQTWTFSEAIDDDIHTQLIDFLESQHEDDARYTDRFAATRVAAHINNAEVRFKYAWRHLSPGHVSDSGQFSVDNDQDLELVSWLRTEARTRGLTSFEAKADALEQAYRVKRQQAAAAQAAELALWQRLRA